MTATEELALRCLLPGFEGTRAPDWVVRRARAGLGGVILFARNIESPAQLSDLTSELHVARPQLLIGVDEEGGDVTRLEARTGSSNPGNLALGVCDDLALTREVASAIGADLAERGIDLNLAPVADINSNPQNPVIGVRSFGSDAGLVGGHVAAWIDGMQGAGVAACAKHFPGHGDTSVDSHMTLPVVSEDPHERALAPFVAAFAGGVQAVMSGHLLVPSIDEAPATTSRRIMEGLLRAELGFTGLAITDGLEMQGMSGDGLDLGERAVRSLIAGCDALCIGGGLAEEAVVDEIVRSVCAAVDQGRLNERRLQEAASRVDAVAAWRSTQGPATRPRPEVGLLAARRAIRSDGQVRVGGQASVLRFESEPTIAAGEVPWGLAEPLALRGVEVAAVEVDAPAHDLSMLLRESADQSLVLLVRDLHRHPEQGEVIDVMLQSRPDAVVVEMGLPQCRPLRANAYVVTHGSAHVCGQAAAEVLRP